MKYTGDWHRLAEWCYGHQNDIFAAFILGLSMTAEHLAVKGTLFTNSAEIDAQSCTKGWQKLYFLAEK